MAGMSYRVCCDWLHAVLRLGWLGCEPRRRAAPDLGHLHSFRELSSAHTIASVQMGAVIPGLPSNHAIAIWLGKLS
jgi:hypothetical protein